MAVDLAEVEDGVDLNESIPEIPPEPVSLSLELVEVDETPRSTTGRRDTLSHTDLEILPEPLSIVIDLTESDDVLETWNGALAEVPPDPVSFSINLVDAPMGSQSFVPETLPSPLSFSIALEVGESDQHNSPDHPSYPSSI